MNEITYWLLSLTLLLALPVVAQSWPDHLEAGRKALSELEVYKAREHLNDALEQAVTDEAGPESISEILDFKSDVVLALEGRDAARETLREVYQYKLERLGPEHPALADTLDRMAEIETSPEAQLLLYREGFELRREALGPDHPKTAKSWTWLGAWYTLQDQPETAIPMFEKAVAILEDEPELAEDLLSALAGLATALEETGRIEEAERVLAQFHEVSKENRERERESSAPAPGVGPAA